MSLETKEETVHVGNNDSGRRGSHLAFRNGASWCLSWIIALPAIFMAGVIVAGIVVSWRWVEQHLAQNDTWNSAVTALARISCR